MAETGASHAATIMIGDTTYDMDMARAAGVGAIGVTWGYHHADELKESEPHRIVDEYADLLPAIDQLFADMKVPS